MPNANATVVKSPNTLFTTTGICRQFTSFPRAMPPSSAGFLRKGAPRLVFLRIAVDRGRGAGLKDGHAIDAIEVEHRCAGRNVQFARARIDSRRRGICQATSGLVAAPGRGGAIAS